ncbi:mechanosensitive ion channel family protein [Candidatus Micrarchaeota archaeon]|nr:mechanosensitive ion channel family protein [Candidatus Micrarchaeota archaeon]MBU1930953.1 mechanosensitive ion channel family protein [Candidatus Micrarchaeota archaeon]
MAELYFGNSIEQWALFLGAIVLALIIGKIVNYIIDSRLKKFAAKTKNEFDDILLGAFEKPLLVVLLIAGISIGQIFLTLDIDLANLFNNIIGAIITLSITWFIINLIDGFVFKFLKKITDKTDSKLDDQLLPVVSKALKAIIIVLAVIVIASSNFGIDVTGPILGLGIGGLAFAFAAKETIADVFGGFNIFTSKPFHVGDFIIVGDVSGTVEEVSLRHTRIRNLDKRIITYPNGKLAGSIIENVSSAPKRKVSLNLGLTYNTTVKQMQKAREIVTKIVNAHPGCEDNPTLNFSEFKDYSLNLLAIYYIEDKDNWFGIRDEINTKIKEEFDKAKLNFAFPTQTVYLEK